MRKIFSVELSGRNGLCGDLDLPASPYQLLDALERLNMKPGGLPEWEVCEYHGFESLAPHLNDQASLHELNELSRALAGLDERQTAAFEGLLQIEAKEKDGPISVGRLTELAYSADCCHVVGDVHNDAQLGRFYAENGFIREVEKVPDVIFDLLDFEMLGRKARVGEGGVFTRHGYIVRHSELEQTPHAPQPPQKPDYIFRLTLANNGVRCDVPLELPATEGELDGALKELGAVSWDEVTLRVEDSAIPDLLEGVDCAGEIRQLNDLAMAVRRLDEDGQLTKYKAALRATGCDDLDAAERLAGRLDKYIWEPDTRTPQDVARGELRIVIDEKSAEILLPHLDLYGYGFDLMERHNSEMTPYGLVERVDGQPLQINQPGQGGMEMM